MKILVPVKRVAALEDDFRIRDDGRDVDPEDLNHDLNEWDNFSLEQAVLIKEAAAGEVQVIAATVGPEVCDEVLRACLAKGADRALRVWGDALAGSDPVAIARVLASETDASFLAVNVADIFSKWLGESEQHVKELFARARARVPAIIFIDEIDAVTERRGDGDSAGDRVRNAVVNMFLAEMDGLDSSTRVFVIGATNRPELLDEALMRPGRLGERIEIPLPDAAGRRAMLALFSKKMRLAASVDLELLAAQTEGASGALLKGLCTLAGRNALVRELDARGIALAVSDVAPAVTQEDFEKAFRELSSPPRRQPIGFNRPEEIRSN